MHCKDKGFLISAAIVKYSAIIRLFCKDNGKICYNRALMRQLSELHYKTHASYPHNGRSQRSRKNNTSLTLIGSYINRRHVFMTVLIRGRRRISPNTPLFEFGRF